mmetsp:Transcript_1276/g.1635  ORF Transcript_1276/g.1635 Transcript_1276/m.1635 type:complete len:92 (+) Transcript_1276:42-317(+)
MLSFVFISRESKRNEYTSVSFNAKTNLTELFVQLAQYNLSQGFSFRADIISKQPTEETVVYRLQKEIFSEYKSSTTNCSVPVWTSSILSRV